MSARGPGQTRLEFAGVRETGLIVAGIMSGTSADGVDVAGVSPTLDDGVYSAMIEIANVVNDKFHIVTRHSADEIIYPEEGILVSDTRIIQVTWVGGRSTDVKKQFYRRIADEIHAKAGVRREDVWINLVDDGREDWSFGNGDIQYAPK
jgi:hypothetical protein